ncbi:MAG: hypothetical protein VR69_16925 [Peptococcaceae bacterium BRH_c4b]|nr:MAG: hypothetical protein VR69_16925 [Peptococcaceae bacterium BRH_c4b]
MFKIISDMKKTIAIDRDKCLSCGLCVDACTCKLLQMGYFPEPRKDRIQDEKQIGNVFNYVAPTCANCRVCIITCPEEAIDILAELPGINYNGFLPEVGRLYPRSL